MLPNEAVNYYHTLLGHRILLYPSVVWVWIRSEFRAGWECFVSSWSKGLSCWDVPSVFNWAKSQRPDVKCFQTLKSLTWISVIRIIFPICIVFSLDVSACGDSVCSLVIGAVLLPMWATHFTSVQSCLTESRCWINCITPIITVFISNKWSMWSCGFFLY